MQIARRRLVSEDEFLSLPESNERVELLDGEVVVSPDRAPSGLHTAEADELEAALETPLLPGCVLDLRQLFRR